MNSRRHQAVFTLLPVLWAVFGAVFCLGGPAPFAERAVSACNSTSHAASACAASACTASACTASAPIAQALNAEAGSAGPVWVIDGMMSGESPIIDGGTEDFGRGGMVADVHSSSDGPKDADREPTPDSDGERDERNQDPEQDEPLAIFGVQTQRIVPEEVLVWTRLARAGPASIFFDPLERPPQA